MLSNKETILVTGATGSQGGAVAAALLNNGHTVRILVRAASANTDPVKKLKDLGASVIIADIDDPEALEMAMSDLHGLFSVQAMDDGTGSERRHADALVTAALKMGVVHVVHVSVSGIDTFESSPGWGANRWNEKYWTDKRYAEEAVKNAGFKYWTILRPTFFMDNFIPPKVYGMYPGLDEGRITVVFNPDKKLQFVDVEDTGKFATAAFNEPEKFNRQCIELAGDELTIGELANLISTNIEVEYVTESEAVKRGMFPALANYQEWTNQVGYSVNIEGLKKYGIPLTNFEQFAERSRDLFPKIK
jgi:uncharacterized protein YbjT (DUF2867 family)